MTILIVISLLSFMLTSSLIARLVRFSNVFILIFFIFFLFLHKIPVFCFSFILIKAKVFVFFLFFFFILFYKSTGFTLWLINYSTFLTFSLSFFFSSAFTYQTILSFIACIIPRIRSMQEFDYLGSCSFYYFHFYSTNFLYLL